MGRALARGEAIGDGRRVGDPATASPEQRRKPHAGGRRRRAGRLRWPLASPASIAPPPIRSVRSFHASLQQPPRVPPVSEHARPGMSSPSSSGIPLRNSEEAAGRSAEQRDCDEGGRDAHVLRRCPPLRACGFSPRHGDTAPPRPRPRRAGRGRRRP